MSEPLEVMREKSLNAPAVNNPAVNAPISDSAVNAQPEKALVPARADHPVIDTVVLPSADDELEVPVNEEAKALALAIAEAADDRKAGDIAILQTGNVSYLADYFVIVTGFSNVQVRAVSNSIEGTVEDKFDNRQPIRTEGMSEGRWVLKDYGDVIVHIFMPTDREYYDLEAFWGHAERIEFVPAQVNA